MKNIFSKVIDLRYDLPMPFMLNSLLDLTNISKIVSPGVYCPGYTDICVLSLEKTYMVR